MRDTIGFDNAADELQNATIEEIRQVYEILGLKYEPSSVEEDS